MSPLYPYATVKDSADRVSFNAEVRQKSAENERVSGEERKRDRKKRERERCVCVYFVVVEACS